MTNLQIVGIERNSRIKRKALNQKSLKKFKWTTKKKPLKDSGNIN